MWESSESENVWIAKNKQWETEICTRTTLVIERGRRGMGYWNQTLGEDRVRGLEFLARLSLALSASLKVQSGGFVYLKKGWILHIALQYSKKRMGEYLSHLSCVFRQPLYQWVRWGVFSLLQSTRRPLDATKTSTQELVQHTVTSEDNQPFPQMNKYSYRTCNIMYLLMV